MVVDDFQLNCTVFRELCSKSEGCLTAQPLAYPDEGSLFSEKDVHPAAAGAPHTFIRSSWQGDVQVTDSPAAGILAPPATAGCAVYQGKVPLSQLCQFLLYVLFWPCCEACEILVP